MTGIRKTVLAITAFMIGALSQPVLADGPRHSLTHSHPNTQPGPAQCEPGRKVSTSKHPRQQGLRLHCHAAATSDTASLSLASRGPRHRRVSTVQARRAPHIGQP